MGISGLKNHSRALWWFNLMLWRQVYLINWRHKAASTSNCTAGEILAELLRRG
jgi:hypothetical protein